MKIRNNLIPFEEKYLSNKELILQMLKYEDKIFLSEKGQKFLADYGENTTSLEGTKTIQRKTLNKYGFSSRDEDIKIYRTIFQKYYENKFNYDKDILNAVYYMRENKCLYYKTKELKIGMEIPNVKIYGLDGEIVYDLHKLIEREKKEKTIIAAFSLS